jgi:excisionase family DNA binding protein
MAHAELDRLYTVSETARALGLAEVTIRTWISQRRIEWVRVGERAVRIPQSEIRRIVEAGTIPTRRGIA